MSIKKLASLMILALCALPTLSWGWWNDDWAFRSKITLDTSRIAPSAEPLARVPLLLRLHEGNFRFLDARSDGTDLRFVAGDDKTPLNYHIEAFDGVASIAYVWVDVPAVEPGMSQEIWLYYGNENASGVASAPTTYDGETALVYHFNETAGTPRDQTANGNNAVSSNAQPTFESLIQQGLGFNGSMQLRIAPSASLNIPAGGPYTWSAWIKAESERPQALATLYTKLSSAGESAPARLSIGLNQNRPFVSIVDANGLIQEAMAKNQIQAGAWVHVAVTAGEQIKLYVNGAEAGVLGMPLPELGGDAVVGALTTTPVSTDSAGFIGKLDELAIANIERSAGWIAFAASSQGREADIVGIALKPEVRGSWLGGGYFGILLGAVTIDGWVVIAILGVMLLISIAVIYSRMSYIRRLGQGNLAFERKSGELFNEIMRRKLSGGHDNQGLPLPADADQYEDSSTFRIYAAGAEEIRQRLSMTAGKPFALGAQGTESLRSAMDSAMVREQLAMNQQMVFLTIAIAGGPFLGLLGTVVGVMITFAAIAAAGDVNVNAIAPGVAAALMATVAGLVVAIPALFAYNYLTTRIRDITAEMQLFANEFVSRVSEGYSRD
jgi:biopolymer transport protein ExbB